VNKGGLGFFQRRGNDGITRGVHLYAHKKCAAAPFFWRCSVCPRPSRRSGERFRRAQIAVNARRAGAGRPGG